MKKEFLLILLIIFLGSCSNNFEDYKTQSENFHESNFTPNSKRSNENQLPPCPTETATHCDRNNILNKHATKSIVHKENNENPESRGCKGTGIVNFTVSPRKIEDISLFAPIGLMLGDHVTPIDHGYFYPPNWKMDVTSVELKDVYVPADGVIVSIGMMPTYFTTTKQPDLQDYRIIIYHTCTFYTIYIHINSLSPRIKEIIGDIKPSENKYVPIEVKAGELLGRANAFDFSVHNNDIILSGFITPKNYEREYWKIHTVDQFDYFVEPVKSQILSKNPRTAEPRGGKIDYDVNGRLIGNWFLEGTNGYAGISNQHNYWVSHLAFAPNAYDPSHFTVSMGKFGERSSKQYGVKGNSPDPKDVGVSSGIIKYELVEFEYIDSLGNTWDSKSFASGIKVRNIEDQERGVVLVQLLEDKKLRIEIFPDKNLDQVSGFTDKSKIYER